MHNEHERREAFQSEHWFALFRDWSSLHPTPRFCFSTIESHLILTDAQGMGEGCVILFKVPYHSWKNCHQTQSDG